MPPWIDDEIILAAEFFVTCPERMHTDSHDKCQEIAQQLNHSPSALDKVLRNIKSAHGGQAGLSHASRRVREIVDQYRNNIPGLRQRAAMIRAHRGLAPLDCGH